MKTAVVILSLNANRKNQWESILQKYAAQNKKFSSYILADSESTDSTVEIARKYGWEIVTEKRSCFNHGGTRQKIVKKLQAEGCDIVIFATQDVILKSADTLSVLTDNLQKTGAAVAYARQLPEKEKSFDGFFRLRNYPPESEIKDSSRISELGLMTAFVSDSLAAWDLKKVCGAGGFPETDFGEDMLMGAKFILDGEKISYCAESCCIHEHDSSWKEIFMRGVEIGKLHERNPFLREKFGKLESCAKRRLKFTEIIRYFIPLCIKYSGYRIGRLKGKKTNQSREK